MTANIPRVPPLLISPSVNTIRAAMRVRGNAQWRPMADAVNWLLGKGSSLVVGGPPGAGAIDPGDDVTLSYYVWPHEQNYVRLWCVSLMSGVANTIVDVSDGLSGTVEIPEGADPQAWTIPVGALTFQPYTFRFIELIDPPDATAGAVDILVSNDSTSGNPLWIAGVCCYELPRTILNSFDASIVVDQATCDTSAPIYKEATDEFSAHAVALAAYNAESEARRSKLFDWCNAAGFAPPQQTSFTGTSNVFPADPFVMVRHLRNGVTSREVAYAVLAATDDTGQVRVKSSATTDTDTLTFDSLTPTWKTGRLTIATEDVPNLASNAGIRSGTRDRLIVETTNPIETTLTLYGIAVAEDG